MNGTLLQDVVSARVEPVLRRAAGRVTSGLVLALFVVAAVANLYAAGFFLLAPVLDLAWVFGVLAAISLVPIAIVAVLQRRRARQRTARGENAARALQLGLAFEAGRVASRNWPLLVGAAAALLLLAGGGKRD